jgi:signal transduction histidine kinase
MVGAAVVVVLSLFYANVLAGRMSDQEKQRMQMLAELIKLQQTIPPDVEGYDFTAISQMIEQNNSVPMILVAEGDLILDARNYRRDFMQNPDWFKTELQALKKQGDPIVLDVGFGGKQYIYYRQSKVLDQLRYFPLVQFALVFMLILIAYLGFNAARKAEQNQVWVGMAKETAHQLGTPISSLVAWVENLRLMQPDNEEVLEVADEMIRDINQLNLVADRFSKIGAKPVLDKHNIYDILEQNLSYIQPRASRKINFDFPKGEHPPAWVSVNPQLFNWVIENLLKNALDAMDGQGTISAAVGQEGKFYYIDVSDTGKGIPKNKFNTIFKPGYSTKKRGWGLGLTLTKRIVEQYHGGKIFVKKSVLNEGTTFRIALPIYLS